MNNYPDVVAKIVNDYLERVKSQLRLAPVREQTEFLAEIESHIYEAYQQTAGEDEVARILAVLRNLGEPAEVVYDRLPGTVASGGAKPSLQRYVVGGILIALFGIPLGFGGLGIILGILAALAGVTVAFCTAAGSIILAGGFIVLLGLIRVLFPPLFDSLVVNGVIHLGAPVADFLDPFTHFEQGLMFILFGSVWLASGLGMLWVGKRLFRWLRFLAVMLFERVRRLARSVRGKYAPRASHMAPGLRDRPRPIM